MVTAKELIRELPKGLIKWQKFKEGSSVLFLGGGEETDDVMVEALAEADLQVFVKNLSEIEEIENREFDYVVVMRAIEHMKDILTVKKVLASIHAVLKRNGKLIIGMDNRLGIRYFCGDKDIFTGRNFDSIENYAHIRPEDLSNLGGRTYSKAEITLMLEQAGFQIHKFYSVFPVLMNPQIILAEDYAPQEKLDVRIFPQYNDNSTVFLEEEKLYSALIENHIFHTMANGFLIECPKAESKDLLDVNQVTVSMERGKENAMYTIIHGNESVEKKPVYTEGGDKIKQIAENNIFLQEHGVKMVEGSIIEGSFLMAYQQGISALEYFRTLIYSDQKLFLRRLEEFWEIILKSSEHVSYDDINWEQFEPGWQKRKLDDPEREKWKRVAFGSQEDREALGVILKRGYIDLVALNCFWTDDGFVFYDQEMYVENLPAKTILLRTIGLIYRENCQLERALPSYLVKKRFNLDRFQNLFDYFTDRYLNHLRNDDLLRTYHNNVRRDVGIVNSNRQRMNFSTDRFDQLFRDIFRGVEGRKIYLFGSGNFAKAFLSRFGNDYEIEGILDNNPEKWGTKWNHIDILSPKVLQMIPEGTYKVIICIKNYVSVIKQLDQMGIKNYSIFDNNLKYPRKVKPVATGESIVSHEAKKYHVGYIAGVFDLFHMGHLNLLKRAKEQCDYLIVGIVNDESVVKNKKTMPFMPFEERMELVKACRYVDEVVEIPTEYNNTDEAYRRYQFDVQFSGSDYAKNPVWLAKQDFLRKQGSDMVFFPYTESTSSTKLKALINKNLL